MTENGAGPLERFRTVVVERFGLATDDGRLAEVLGQRLQTTRLGEGEYLSKLETATPGATAGRAELRALAQELSVPETSFFRCAPQFLAFRHEVLPRLLAERGEGHLLRVLSAGCAAGEEPHSLAIVLLENLPRGRRFEVHAVDMNPSALAKARSGRYTPWSLRDVSEETKRRWFTTEGRELVLARRVCEAVTLHERSLFDDDPSLWRDRAWDVVFFRNVMMYFAPSKALHVVARIERSLAGDGFLFLGHAESLRGVSDGFHLCQSNDSFYYRRRGGDPVSCDPGPPAPPALPTVFPGEAEAASVAGRARSWADSIATASNRVRALATPGAATVSPAPPPALPRPGDLTLALNLLRGERYQEALDLLDAAPQEASSVPDALLLRAVLLTHLGLFAAAEESCRELLALDDLNSGARYLLALCREAAGDGRGAAEEARAAAYLDPTFSMPRLQLGLMARRAGDLDRARRELHQALALLRQEDASRLLLYGGGFGREVLHALCRAELVASGGTP